MKPLTEQQKEKIESLLEEMTIEEKIGQMNQISPLIVGGFDVSFEELIEMMTDGRISKEEFGRLMAGAKQDYHDDVNRAGGLSSVLISDPEMANQLQKIAVEETRLGIPLLFGFDVIHGFRTVVPIALAEAGTFEMDLIEKTGRIAAKESRAFCPNGGCVQGCTVGTYFRRTRRGSVSGFAFCESTCPRPAK